VAGWAVLFGGVVGMLLSLLTADWHRRETFDTWQRLSPREIGTDKVAVVLIDNADLENFGPWPWSRYYLALLTDHLARQAPSAIAYDIIFAGRDSLDPALFSQIYGELDPATSQRVARLPSQDDGFAQAIGSAPVVLARLATSEGQTDPSQLMIDPEVAGRPPSRAYRATKVLTSIPALDDVALGHAMINGPPDDDGVVRRVPLAVVVGGTTMPGMAVELARATSGAQHLEWQGSRLRMGGATIPADDEASLMLRFGRFPDRAIYSASDVIAGEIPKSEFAGKVVLVGLGAAGTVDLVTTPLASQSYGVLVQAQAVDAILSGAWLSRPAWVSWAEIAASLALLVLILIAGGTRRHWLLGPALLLAIALPFLSWLAFDRFNLMIDPVRPLMVGACAAVAIWITLYALARAERARLAAALVEQRITAAEQEGELKAARRIQLGMVPGAERLARLDPRVSIGAVLEPARSVGGDFYDAAMVGADRLLFLIGDVTGKGIPAALYMALSKALSKSNLSRAGDDLGAGVAALNRDLMAEADEEMGVTMLAGLFDSRDGSLALVNAGHENPLIVRADGTVVSLPLEGGPPLCVVDFPYRQEAQVLAAGETLVLITDGATEAENEEGQMFGLAGVVAALQSEGAMPADERAVDLARRVRAFEGETEPSDDLTILAIGYRGSSG
jgi:serine phosphatase RsbU (regulator of sigma subunit)/CHASE2 domain-containing sensor protein